VKKQEKWDRFTDAERVQLFSHTPFHDIAGFLAQRAWRNLTGCQRYTLKQLDWDAILN
jgi:hypothetical protein